MKKRCLFGLATISIVISAVAGAADAQKRKRVEVPDSLVAVLSATNDLELSDGSVCGLGSGVSGKQRILTNRNTTKRVVATITTTSPQSGFDYYTSSRGSTRYTYPRVRDELLNPGEFRAVGCSDWNVRSQIVHQDFAISGAYYPADDVTFPKNENAFDFAILLTMPYQSCEAEGQGGKLEFLGNIHPNRKIEVSWKSARGNGTDGFDVVLDPQGRAPTIGCTAFEGESFNYTISAAKFVQ